MTTHNIPLELANLHGYFSSERAPILTIEPGDSIICQTIDAGWGGEPYTPDPTNQRRKFPGYDKETDGDGHAMIGPIAIQGAKPGMTLAVRINEIIPGAWGGCFAGGWQSSVNARYGIENEGVAHVWTLDRETMTGRNHMGHTVTLRPFMGVMGAPAGQVYHLAARFWQLDCGADADNALLPIPVEGACSQWAMVTQCGRRREVPSYD